MEEKKRTKINIGLDLGIASVGWAVVNADKFEIIDAGVRLFPEAGGASQTSTNEDRRIKRSIRRQKRRKKLRLEDFRKLCHEYGYVEIEDDNFWKEPLSEPRVSPNHIRSW